MNDWTVVFFTRHWEVTSEMPEARAHACEADFRAQGTEAYAVSLEEIGKTMRLLKAMPQKATPA